MSNRFMTLGVALTGAAAMLAVSILPADAQVRRRAPRNNGNAAAGAAIIGAS